MTSPFRPGFLYDRGISRTLQQTSHDRGCSRTLRRSLSHKPSRRTEHSSPERAWKLAVRGVWLLRERISTKKVHFFWGNSCHIQRRCLQLLSYLAISASKARPSQQPCPRFCRTARGKWADTEGTTMWARCPSAAGCRTPTRSSVRRRGKDHRNLDRSEERREVRVCHHNTQNVTRVQVQRQHNNNSTTTQLSYMVIWLRLVFIFSHWRVTVGKSKTNKTICQT